MLFSKIKNCCIPLQRCGTGAWLSVTPASPLQAVWNAGLWAGSERGPNSRSRQTTVPMEVRMAQGHLCSLKEMLDTEGLGHSHPPSPQPGRSHCTRKPPVEQTPGQCGPLWPAAPQAVRSRPFLWTGPCSSEWCVGDTAGWHPEVLVGRTWQPGVQRQP